MQTKEYRLIELEEEKNCKQGDTINLEIKISPETQSPIELTIHYCGHRLDIRNKEIIKTLKDFLNNY